MQDLNSGKTHTLKAIAKALKTTPKTALYTAFQKSVVLEGQETLSNLVECRTLHSLAYHYVYPHFKTELHSGLEIRMLPSSIPYDDKVIAIEAVEKFFTSESITMCYFDYLKAKHKLLAVSIIDGVVDGRYPITFNFLLKYFHLCLVDGTIEAPYYELLMLDEAGDTTGVILEIFKLIKAKKKIMAGDPEQNIYAFMNTINGFHYLKNEGILLSLSKSFRVNKVIAKEIERFVQANLDSTMTFKGVETSGKPQNIAFISATNASLVSRMFILTRAGKSFKLLRSAQEIFALPLAVITASTGKEVYNKRYKYLEKDYKCYTKDKALNYDTSFLLYLKRIYPDNIQLSSTISLLHKHGYSEIFQLYGQVKNNHSKASHRILSTVHTAKGITVDAVFIEDDLNKITASAQEGETTEENLTTLRLAYTAVTRARLAIFNCEFLKLPDYNIDIYIN